MGPADADHARGVQRERPRQPLSARFAAQLLAGRRAGSPVEACERLLAVQAQDPRGFRLALRARCRGPIAVRDVDAALDSGELVVSWLNRGTLHLVRRQDFWWLHALTVPQVTTGNARRLAEEGVPPAAADRGVAAVERVLADGPATRAELREAVSAAGVRVDGQAFAHVLILAALRGVLVRGPMAGREHAYVLARDWVGPPPRIDRDAALAELAVRYLRGHGPGDERDLAKWAGIQLTAARRALSLAPPPRPVRAAEPRPALLGAFDPVLLGWASRAWLVGPDEPKIVRGGLFAPFALVDGRAVATWRLDGGRVVLEPFAHFDPSVLDAETRDVARFLAG